LKSFPFYIESFLVFADDPKPEVGAAGASTAASSRAQAAEDTSKRLDQVREICPDLVEEIKEDWDKKEVCKKCGDKVSELPYNNCNGISHLIDVL